MYKILILISAALFLTSCMKSPRYTMLQEDVTGRAEIVQKRTENISHRTHIITSDSDLLFVADSMVSNAEKLASNGKPQAAQNLLSILFEFFTVPEYICEQTEAVLNRVAHLYVETLPVNYTDFVPLPIAAFVARYQFQMLMDEIDTTTVDMSLFPMECVSGTIFNLPITYNHRVQQALQILLAERRQERMLRLLNRSLIYRPFMKEMFEEAGLPTDITFLPLLESAFNSRAYSHAHASGLWQFIPSTGTSFGLRQNYWADERRDPYKSTAAAIAYFTRLYGMFDDWYLALAAYNAGNGRIRRHIANGVAANPDTVVTYWDMQLPRETMSYVPLFIGYQIIGRNPTCFGFFPDSSIAPFAFDTVSVSSVVEMSRIAKELGIPLDTLRRMNPAVKHDITPPNMKNFTLYVPQGSRETFTKFYASLKPEDRINWFRYRVAAGDNLNNVARRFDVPVAAIRDLNQMRGNTLTAGRHILLPLADNAETAARITRAIEEERKARARETATGRVNHRVASGETLGSIARMHGVSLSDVQRWNPDIEPRRLRVGSIVIIHTNREAAAAAQTQAATAPAGAAVGTQAAQAAPSERPVQAQQRNGNAAQTPPPAAQTTAQPAAPVQQQTASSTSTSGKERRTHIVQSGENLFRISRNLNVSLSDLAAWNNKDVNNPIIRVGETLVYYADPTTAAAQTPPAATTPPPAPAVATAAPAATSTNANANTTAAANTNGEIINYRVGRGDTFYSIARMFSTTVADLEALNNITASQLQAGQMIRVRNNTVTGVSN